MRKYFCYTDGSYQASLGQGGWSSIILDEDNNLVAKLYQGFSNTTNNRMELRAIIETLKYFNDSVELEIFSDSQYVLQNIERAKYWFENNKLDKANLDLWFELIGLLPKHTITFHWVKGHDGNKWNEEADKWCVFAARCLNLQKDTWTTN